MFWEQLVQKAMVCSLGLQTVILPPLSNLTLEVCLFLQSIIHSLNSNQQLAIGHLRRHYSEHETYMALYRGPSNFCQSSGLFVVNCHLRSTDKGYRASQSHMRTQHPEPQSKTKDQRNVFANSRLLLFITHSPLQKTKFLKNRK